MDTNQRTPSEASGDRAKSYRLFVDGKSKIEIASTFRDDGDHNVTVDRVSRDLNSVTRDDLTNSGGDIGLFRIAKYQNIIELARDGFSRNADIGFLNLILELEERIEGIE